MIRRLSHLLIASSLPLSAETVIITTVPDETRPMAPLTSLGGIPLDGSAQVRVGAFSGLSDAALLDLAATAGLTGISSAFAPFGATASIGQGVNGAAGGFEISIRDTGAVALDGEVISLLLQTPGGEFLIARFHGSHFEAQTATGLEPLHSLHLADAKLIAGNHVGEARLSTSAAPAVGSYASWIDGFAAITNPTLKLAGADADGDGRSNFLEYATGGDPTSAGDDPACEILPDGIGGMWVRFRRVPGLGSVRYTPQVSQDLQSAWQEATLPLEPEPGNASILRLHLNPPMANAGFFRLLVE